MNIIVPMAGMGKRMRPHTLTMPKPLFKIAGKTIVERLIEDISETVDDNIQNIGFVVGRFGDEVENSLLMLAKKVGAKGHIFYQDEALGTGHAVYMAEQILEGPCFVAFADTLFKTGNKIQNTDKNIIWTYEVDNPSAYGVVKTNDKNEITDFIEKPKDPVSNKAIIGIYYFSEGEHLRAQLKNIIEQDIRVGTEYQLTTALENMKNDGSPFAPFVVEGWYDCGNKAETLKTNRSVLSNIGNQISSSVTLKNTVVIEPVFIGNGVNIENSVVGPFVSIENNTTIKNTVINNAIVKDNTSIENGNISESIIGSNVKLIRNPENYNIGDFNEI